jgi:hypothetical protein
VTEEELKFYRKRQLEIHEERGRERQLQADAALARAMAAARVLRGDRVKRPRSR